MTRFLAIYTLSALLTTAAYADAYQRLLKAYNDHEPATSLYTQIGQNLSKRVTTDAERSNLSFIAIYGAVAQWDGKSLSDQISTLVRFSPGQIDDASLSADERRYRIDHYVHLVVLCVASHMSNESQSHSVSPDAILAKIKEQINLLRPSLQPDVYSQLGSLNVNDITKMLADFNFQDSHQLAKEYVKFYESIRGSSGKMPGDLLSLSRDKPIEYQKEIQAVREFIRTYEVRKTASPAPAPRGTNSDATTKPQLSLQEALLARTKKPVSSVASSIEGQDDSSLKPQISLKDLLSGRSKAANSVEGQDDSSLKPQIPLAELFGGGRKAARPVSSSSENDDAPSGSQKDLRSLFGEGGRSKAEEMRRNSLAAMEMGQTNFHASRLTGTVSPTSVTENVTGAWTVEKLEADAIRQIDASKLSDDLTETVSDADGNDIQISPKEKAKRDVKKFIKMNKPSIENGTFSIEQFATRIGDPLAKKGVEYINPIASKVLTGYVKAAHTQVAAPALAKAASVVSAEDIRANKDKMDAKKAAKKGLSLAEYREEIKTAEEEQDSRNSLAAASLPTQQKTNLTADEKRKIFLEKAPERDALDKKIKEKEIEKTSLLKDSTEKQKELEKINRQLTSGRQTISDEERDRINNIIKQNRERVEELTRELGAITEEDEELKSIPQKIKDVDESGLTVIQKTRQKGVITARKQVLEKEAKGRKTKESAIKASIRDLESAIARNQRQLDSGDATEELRAEQTKLESDLAQMQTKTSQLEKQIKVLNVDRINIFTDNGLGVADVEIFEEAFKEQLRLKNAATSANLLRSGLINNKFHNARVESDSDSDSDDED